MRALFSVVVWFRPASGNVRFLNSKIPMERVGFKPKEKNEFRVSDDTIQLLERLSLVDFSNVECIQRLNDAVAFADPIKRVVTDGVEPLYSILENEALRLRDDVPESDATRQDILANAAVSEEDFFVAPPGNVPLHQSDNKYFKQ